MTISTIDDERHQRKLKAAVERMKLEPMPTQPQGDIWLKLPDKHKRMLERFKPHEISAMRVKAQRLLDEATAPSGRLLTDEQVDVLKRSAALFIVTGASVLLEVGSNALMAWLDTR